MEDTKERNKIITLYAVLFFSLIGGFVPHVLFAVIAILLFIGGMIAAYSARGKAEPHSLTANHMTYLIRTIWIVSLMVFVTTLAAGFYVLGAYDPTPVNACAERLMNMTDVAAMEQMVRPCMDDFVRVNFQVFMIGLLIAAGPVIPYFLWRLLKGLNRARNGYRLADEKSWL